MKTGASFIAIISVFLAACACASDEPTDYDFGAADEVYDPETMRQSRMMLRQEMGGVPQFMLLADRLEYRNGDNEDGVLWDAQGWYGGDLNKLWIKAEGDYSSESDRIEDAELQVLWSHAISPFFDLQSGVRYDFEPSGLAHAVIGLQGLAPYWLEVDAAAFLSEDGDLTAHIETEYDWLLTQRLILQRRGALELSAQDIPERRLGSGLTRLEAALRLRYEFRREFAPYLGIEWTRAFGGTADIIEAAGGDSDEFSVVAGVRFWF